MDTYLLRSDSGVGYSRCGSKTVSARLAREEQHENVSSQAAKCKTNHLALRDVPCQLVTMIDSLVLQIGHGCH